LWAAVWHRWDPRILRPALGDNCEANLELVVQRKVRDIRNRKAQKCAQSLAKETHLLLQGIDCRDLFDSTYWNRQEAHD
jgi:hypothetical protein